ncbi:MAG: lysozyme inhibitor LprI family protein [Pseudomonadota bacterium]
MLMLLGSMLLLAQDVPLEIERRYSPGYLACRNRRGVALGECNTAELKIQDDRLNRIWVRVMTGLPDARRRALRLLERKWIRERDRACAALANPDAAVEWKSGDRTACLVHATIRRTMWLERVR